MMRWRQLVRDYERLPETHEAMVKWTMTAYVLAVLAAEDTDAALLAAKGLVGGGPAAEYLVWRREPCPRTGGGRCSPVSCTA